MKVRRISPNSPFIEWECKCKRVTTASYVAVRNAQSGAKILCIGNHMYRQGTNDKLCREWVFAADMLRELGEGTQVHQSSTQQADRALPPSDRDL